jgi:hypothetical protein
LSIFVSDHDFVSAMALSDAFASIRQVKALAPSAPKPTAQVGRHGRGDGNGGNAARRVFTRRGSTPFG